MGLQFRPLGHWPEVPGEHCQAQTLLLPAFNAQVALGGLLGQGFVWLQVAAQ